MTQRPVTHWVVAWLFAALEALWEQKENFFVLCYSLSSFSDPHIKMTVGVSAIMIHPQRKRTGAENEKIELGRVEA